MKKIKIEFILGIKKIIVISVIGLIITTNLTNVFAVNIGTASVSGTTVFDNNVIWDGNLPGSSTGSVSGIKILAIVNPILNMKISTGSINLGVISNVTSTTGSLNIEVGTNSITGVNVTVRSSSGGLTNITDNNIVINNNAGPLIKDSIPDNYSFSSSTGSLNDSNFIDYNINNVLTSTEINDNITNHIIYSTNRPENSSANIDDIVFKVSAQTNTQTAAGNYQDTVTFTVVGNF